MAYIRAIQQKPKGASDKKSPGASASVFSGEHLWINHDAKHMRTAPHRHQVFTHIQRRYRPFKKRSGLKSARPAASPAPHAKNNSKHDELVALNRVPSPITLVASGNSDPFSVLPVTIGPEENELISFYRDVFLPAQYSGKMPVDKLRQKDWRDSTQGLLDEGIAHGSLARWGHMLAPSTPRLYAVSVTHQLKSTRLLRQKISKGEDLQSYDNYMHLNMLYSAETISRNYIGARFHGNMLRRLFEEAWRRGTLDYSLLVYQVHNDMQTSTMFLEPTVFDLDGFVPMVMNELQKSCEDHLPQVDTSKVNSTLSECVDGDLAKIFGSVRASWKTLGEVRTPSAAPQTPSLGMLTAMKEILNSGRAVNHYVRVKEQLRQQPGRSRSVKLLAETFLSVAAVYITKTLNLDARCLGRSIFDIRPAVFPALRRSLDTFAVLATHTEYQRFGRARVWALYCGALAEQQYPAPLVDPCHQWFNNRLAIEARQLGLLTWSDLQPVLDTFIYNDRASPPGEDWFDRLMSMNSTTPPWTASLVQGQSRTIKEDLV